MAKYVVYANVMQLHKVEVMASNKQEAELLAEDFISADTCYETDYVEINGVERIGK